MLEQMEDTLWFDPRIVFTAPEDGTYYVRTFAFPADPNSTIQFAGAASYIYRLTLTTGPFVDHSPATSLAFCCRGTGGIGRLESA